MTSGSVLKRAVGVEPLGAVGRLRGARPLDAAALAQPLVGQAACSRTAGPPSTPSTPRRPPRAVATRSAARRRGRGSPSAARSRGRCRGRRAPRRAARRPCSQMCTVRSAFVNVPVFSPQVAAGSTTSASCAVSVRKRSWTTTNSSSRAQDRADRARARAATRPGSSPRSTAARSSPARRSARSAWRASAAPSAGSSPRRRSTARRARATCSALSQLRKPGQVAVGAGLARVLRRRLAVHLQHAGAGAAEHAAQQVDVVDLAGRGRRLVGLVEALQHGRQQALAGAEQLGRRGDVARRDLRRSRAARSGV